MLRRDTDGAVASGTSMRAACLRSARTALAVASHRTSAGILVK